MKILLLLFFIPCIAAAQITGKRIDKPITIFDSIQVSPGDTIFLASGTDRRGDFVSIFQPPNLLIGAAEESLSRSYSGKYLVIKHFKNQKHKKTGEKIIAVVTPGGLNYIADMEMGIDLGEISKINSRSFEKKSEPVTVKVEQKLSVADEIAKLKKLHDDGILTKDEYEAQKKKLLEQ